MKAGLVSWLLILQFVLPFLVISIVLLGIILKSRKQTKESVRVLITKIKNNESHEKNALQDFLIKKVKLPDESAKIVVKKIINERKFLFRNLISGLLDKNAEAIETLDNDLTRITDHYHGLDISAVAAASEDVEAVKEDNQAENKIGELKKEVKALKHEVHVTLTTLNNIFAEFSSMFGEEVPNREMSVDQIITAMESFAGKSSDTKDSTAAQPDVADAFSEESSADGMEDLNADIDAALSSLDAPEAENEVAPSNAKSLDDKENTSTEAIEDFSIDEELDDIESALDGLELGHVSEPEIEDDEPSWDEAFDESGDDKKG